MILKIDEALKKKCPRVALGCVTARVEANASPAGLTEELNARDAEIQKLPFPRGVGVAAGGGDARGVQGAGKRSGAIP